MTEFNHLSLAEIAECERLTEEIHRQPHKFPTLRWFELWPRRVFPDRGHNKGDAA